MKKHLLLGKLVILSQPERKVYITSKTINKILNKNISMSLLKRYSSRDRGKRVGQEGYLQNVDILRTRIEIITFKWLSFKAVIFSSITET